MYITMTTCAPKVDDDGDGVVEDVEKIQIPASILRSYSPCIHGCFVENA